MFIDEVLIRAIGGKGGDGAVSFFPMRHGPNGGPGGNGGSVFVQGDKQMIDLHKHAGTKVYKGSRGEIGRSFRKNGSDGEDKVIKVPLSTLVRDTVTGYEFEVMDDETVHLLSRGGRGGRGNMSFATPTHQVPYENEPGEAGEEKTFRMILKLIADFGLIGLPNAGKSSLLNELTSAQVKTAMYAFTTLEPNLGVFEDKVIADIPGLIEGASQGKGLGFKFLKHVEKVPVIIHCIASDSLDIEKDYQTVHQELASYNAEIAKKEKIILLTKTDLIDRKTEKELITLLQKFQKIVLPVSIYNPEEYEALREFMRSSQQ